VAGPIEEIGARFTVLGAAKARAEIKSTMGAIKELSVTTVEADARMVEASRAVSAAQTELAAKTALYADARTQQARMVSLAAEQEAGAVKDAMLIEAKALTATASAARGEAVAARAALTASRQSAAGIARANTEMAASTATSASKFAGTMAKIGKTSLLVGAVVAVASLKMAGDFQQNTNVLVTAAGESVKGLAIVRKGIKTIAVETGTSYKELEAGAYLLAKANYHGADAMTVLRAAAQGAREENASLASVTNAMTSVMASYHLGPEKAVQVMNALKTGAGQAKVTMEEFAASLSTVIPIASSVGISVAEVFGAVGTLTQHGTTAHEATQEVGATIRGLVKMNRPQMAELSQLGLNPSDITANLGTRGLTGTLSLITGAITSHMGKGGQVVMNAFNQSQSARQDLSIMKANLPQELQSLAAAHSNGSISAGSWKVALKNLPTTQASLLQQYAVVDNKAQGFNQFLRSGDPAAQTYTAALARSMGTAIGLNTALQLTGPENMAGTKSRVAAVNSSITNPSTNVEGWASTQKLFNVAVDRGKMAIEGLLISIGTKLIPIVMKLGHIFMETVRWFKEHKTTTEALAVAIGVVLAAAITLAVVAMGAAVVAFLGITAPVAAVVIGIALLGAGFVALWNTSKTFRTIIITVFQTVGDVVLSTVKLMLEALKGFAWVSDKLFGTHFVKTIDGAIKGIDKLQYKLDHMNDPKPIVVKVVAQLDPALHALGFIGPTVAEGLAAQHIAGPYAPSTTGAAARPPGFIGPIVPHRALGGPVTAGMPYLVGEKGPELITPTSNGQVSTANDTAMMMGRGTVNIHAGAIVINESQNPQKTYEAAKRGISDALARK
jgi:TP901 family phage tail tape measure protein